MMKSNSFLVVLLLSAVTLSILPNLANASHEKRLHHARHAFGSHQCKHRDTTPPCCTTAQMRFEAKNKEYCEGCQAAASYVQGEIGTHSKSWNEGFTDCRFNVYRSMKTEIEAEKTICSYSHCCR